MCSFFGAVSASTITRRNTDRRSGLLGSVVFPANRPPLRRRGIGVCFVRLRPVRPSASSCPQGRSPYLRVGVAARSFRLPDCGARTSASAAGCLRHSLRTRPAVQAVFRHGAFPAKQTARLPAFLHRSFSLCALGPPCKRFSDTGRSLRNDPRDRPLSCIGPSHSAYSARSTSGFPARAVRGSPPPPSRRRSVRLLLRVGQIADRDVASALLALGALERVARPLCPCAAAFHDVQRRVYGIA